MAFDYEEPLFRPPSEANSLIIQATSGCSWNRCAFCEMYSAKEFKIFKIDKVLKEIKEIADLGYGFNKFFIADGNAFVLPTAKLLKIVAAIKENFPKMRRVSAYALPSDIIRKSERELEELNDAGLNLLYIGIETGDEELLKLVDKGETYSSTVEGLLKAQNAGINLSTMIINGLGGRKYAENHALNSAKIVNEIQPRYLSTLVLSFPFGAERFRSRFKGEFEPMNPFELIEELKRFIENLDLKETIFRSDHASNYLILRGVLSKDKDKLMEKTNYALENPKSANLRPEWARGL